MSIAAKRSFIEDLKVKNESFDLAIQMRDFKRADKEIIEVATRPGSAFAPSLNKHVGVGLVLGFLLAAGVVFLMEVTDRKIYSVDILQKVTALPTLAMIPKIGQKALR